MKLRACDHCYQMKEKCSFTLTSKACDRCQHLNIACSRSRKQTRRGRRPVLKHFTHGELQIWELPGAAEQSQTRALDRKLATVCVHRGRTNVDAPDESSRARQGEEKAGGVPAQMCQEIFRWDLAAETVADALNIIRDDDRFTVIHAPFVIGRSFIQEFRAAIHSAVTLSAPMLTDGYLAFLKVVARCQSSRVGQTSSDLHRGAKALQILRTAEITTAYDALSSLLLGQALFVFEILTDSFTTSAHSIVQRSLISVVPWYSALSWVPALDTVILCPIFLDIVGCLVYRRCPIIEPCTQGRLIVDRYVGVSVPLLSLLYQLCAQSHAAKSKPLPCGYKLADEERTWDCYTSIEYEIISWVPEVPPDFLTAFDTAERRLMMTQARAYRLAALLVIHRLRYPLGVNDDLGRHYANRILDEIRLFFAHSGTQGASAFPVTFPLFISMLEFDRPAEDLLESLVIFPLQSFCMTRLLEFVRQVRSKAASGFTGVWFDLVESDLTYAVIP